MSDQGQVVVKHNDLKLIEVLCMLCFMKRLVHLSCFEPILEIVICKALSSSKIKK